MKWRFFLILLVMLSVTILLSLVPARIRWLAWIRVWWLWGLLLSPFWLPAAFWFFSSVIPRLSRRSPEDQFLDPRCRKCGYSMKAHTYGDNCPECGQRWEA